YHLPIVIFVFLSSFLSILPPPPQYTLFPYTTLFRSTNYKNIYSLVYAGGILATHEKIYFKVRYIRSVKITNSFPLHCRNVSKFFHNAWLLLKTRKGG